MARPLPCADQLAPQEESLLRRLHELYAEQKRIYQSILQLSRTQGDLVRRGASLRQIQGVLQEKRDCLDRIAGLQADAGQARLLWEQGRQLWSAAGRARLHQDLQEVGSVLEEILLCEEDNDRHLLESVGA